MRKGGSRRIKEVRKRGRIRRRRIKERERSRMIMKGRGGRRGGKFRNPPRNSIEAGRERIQFTNARGFVFRAERGRGRFTSFMEGRIRQSFIERIMMSKTRRS